MRTTEVILLVAFLGVYLVGWAAADGNESNGYILSPEAREELVAFVNEAKDFVLEVGQDKALEAFNDPKGKFVRGELFINAHDPNGTILANPYQPETIGQNLLNNTDLNGVAFVKILHDSDKRGGGFAYAIRPNPAHSNAEELKLFYSLEVDEGLGLTSGMYLPGQGPIFSNDSREDLVAFVEKAKGFALNHTKDDALKAFNDRNGEFVRGNRYIFAYDFEGNILALPFEPELIRTNRIEFRDPNGAYSFQAVLDAAKRGSGFAYAIYQDPAENMTSKLKLDYVTNVDDKWFLGSGTYWPEA
jgi:polar amino acid transport system substrate-binding protein